MEPEKNESENCGITNDGRHSDRDVNPDDCERVMSEVDGVRLVRNELSHTFPELDMSTVRAESDDSVPTPSNDNGHRADFEMSDVTNGIYCIGEVKSTTEDFCSTHTAKQMKSYLTTLTGDKCSAFGNKLLVYVVPFEVANACKTMLTRFANEIGYDGRVSVLTDLSLRKPVVMPDVARNEVRHNTKVFRGTNYDIVERRIPIRQLEFDGMNKRIIRAGQTKPYSQEKCNEMLLAENTKYDRKMMRILRRKLVTDTGNFDPLVVYAIDDSDQDGEARYCVIDGNTRTAVMREAAREWKHCEYIEFPDCNIISRHDGLPITSDDINDVKAELHSVSPREHGYYQNAIAVYNIVSATKDVDSKLWHKLADEYTPNHNVLIARNSYIAIDDMMKRHLSQSEMADVYDVMYTIEQGTGRSYCDKSNNLERMMLPESSQNAELGIRTYKDLLTEGACNGNISFVTSDNRYTLKSLLKHMSDPRARRHLRSIASGDMSLSEAGPMWQSEMDSDKAPGTIDSIKFAVKSCEQPMAKIISEMNQYVLDHAKKADTPQSKDVEFALKTMKDARKQLLAVTND